ncbi:MAG: peptide transporter [Betaproteobacteria bacterium]|nr:MAG: peptide transporter [Betaproteobacteria bacterium]
MTTVSAPVPSVRRWQWLPVPGTWKYHAFLAAVGLFVLGPLGGLAASYMNFSIGFYVSGQVLAGILGSTVTFGYGADGKHGANYIQTIAASVAQMSAMAVVLQAMVWLGLPQPPVWKALLYLTCIGMFGVGVGMLLTPILVDRMQLTYPSGLAVANILRALTDPVLLRRSVATLGSGMLTGFTGGILTSSIAWLGKTGLSTATFGAGMIVGARIALPVIVAGLTGYGLTPFFISIGWLHAGDPFRKITFLIGLGLILGASLIDVSLILWEAARRLRNGSKPADEATAPVPELEPWKKTNPRRLVLWVLAWGAGIAVTGTTLMGVPLGSVLFALALAVVLVLVTGIATGMTDNTPISSAFVVTVILLAALGLRDPGMGMIAATVVLVSCGVAADMQQDRSTGWRLGTNRTIQFRYQVGGILVGAVMAVVYARLFMSAYPVLAVDQTSIPADQQPVAWASAMTYKFVGALRSLTDDKPYQRTAIWIGIGIGAAVQIARLALRASRAYRSLVAESRVGYAIGFALDAFVLPSPYAYAFGFFLNLSGSAWFGAGGAFSSLYNTWSERRGRRAGEAAPLPSDMSPTSLVGGGLIAGDALAALTLGLIGLTHTLLG